MKKQKKTLTPETVIPLFFMALVVGFIVYQFIPSTPHYSSGQCYENVQEPTEKWEENKVTVYKVVEIGTKNYKTAICGKYECSSFNSWPFERFESYFNIPVKCPEAQ